MKKFIAGVLVGIVITVPFSGAIVVVAMKSHEKEYRKIHG